MTENIPEQNLEQQLPPYKLAFVIDGEVVDILHTDERLAAIFTSNPLIIDVTKNFIENEENIVVGGTYDYITKEFNRRVE